MCRHSSFFYRHLQEYNTSSLCGVES
jgi:hypothetical protein